MENDEKSSVLIIDKNSDCSSSDKESVGDNTDSSHNSDSSDCDSCECDSILDHYNYLDDSNLTEEKRLKIE